MASRQRGIMSGLTILSLTRNGCDEGNLIKSISCSSICVWLNYPFTYGPLIPHLATECILIMQSKHCINVYHHFEFWNLKFRSCAKTMNTFFLYENHQTFIIQNNHDDSDKLLSIYEHMIYLCKNSLFVFSHKYTLFIVNLIPS